MAKPLPFILVNKMTLQVRIFFTDIILDLITQVSNNKNKFCKAGFLQLLNNNAENSFTGKWYKRFGLRICMRAKFGTSACHRNNCFHVCFVTARFFNSISNHLLTLQISYCSLSQISFTKMHESNLFYVFRLNLN